MFGVPQFLILVADVTNLIVNQKLQLRICCRCCRNAPHMSGSHVLTCCKAEHMSQQHCPLHSLLSTAMNTAGCQLTVKCPTWCIAVIAHNAAVALQTLEQQTGMETQL